MSKTIKYEISRQTEQFHWESIEIPSMTTGLLIQAGMQEKCRCMAFILVKDPDGIIRLQKLLGHGEQKLGIGLTTRETSIGGVPEKSRQEHGRLELEYLQNMLPRY